MTIQEALHKTQGRDAGSVNRSAVTYAETLISPDEIVKAAVIANISTQRGRFPGVVVLTDQRFLAACGLPGIKRSVSLRLDELEKCEETGSFLNYKAVFRTKEDGFSLTIDPEVGERFSRCLAILRGEVEEFDAVNGVEKGGILNPVLKRNMLRKHRTREKEKAHRKAKMATVNEHFVAGLKAESAVFDDIEENVKTVAARLAKELAKDDMGGQE